MKILILDEEFPYPLNSGKRARSFNLNSRLAKKHEVRWLAWGDPDSEACRYFASVGIHPIAVKRKSPPRSGAGFYLRLLWNLFQADPYIVTSHFGSAMQRCLEQQLQEFAPDVVLCEWSPYSYYLRGIISCPVVVVAHNVEARIWQRYFQHETNPLKRWYIGQQARKVQQFESRMLGSISGLTTVTEEEREFFSRLDPSLPIRVIDNGVDLDYFRSASVPLKTTELVFAASMDWRPNQDAAMHLVQSIFPRIKAEVPNATLTLVGRNPPPHIRALAQVAGVTVTGTVDDVRPYLDRAAVCVVPIRIGGGSRLKILDALAMSKAVVSTHVGAEGLHVRHGENIALADSDAEFSAAVVSLIHDPHQARSLGMAGRARVEERYGWDILAQRLSAFLSLVVGEHAKPALHTVLASPVAPQARVKRSLSSRCR
ncbi:MAG: glycosyltransferase family 4 protein [Gammaproteobacteria bacterium]